MRTSGATRDGPDDLSRLLTQLMSEGKVVHATAPRPRATRSCSTRHRLLARADAADRNPDKWGSESIATGIPIISEEDSRRMRPDYYLALPWHFLDEFLQREVEFLDRGGRFIVPLPNVRIVPE